MLELFDEPLYELLRVEEELWLRVEDELWLRDWLLEDEEEEYETIEDIWPDYPQKEDFFFDEEEY